MSNNVTVDKLKFEYPEVYNQHSLSYLHSGSVASLDNTLTACYGRPPDLQCDKIV